MRHVLRAILFAVSVAACQQQGEVKTSPQVEAAPPEMPADAPPQEEVIAPAPLPTSPTATDGSCLSEVGAAASARLVERCIAVSPATRPPCNAANPCALIQGEIDRACQMFPDGPGKPSECGA